MLHADNIKWQFKGSMNLENQHHTFLRDDELGLQCESISNKTCGGYGIGKSKSYYFIDGDDREFLSTEELADAYNEKFKFNDENPEHEVKYIKIITKRVRPK